MTTYDHTQGKPVGAVVFGDRRVRGCTGKQAAFIDRLLAERVHALPYASAEQVNIRHASRVIEHLLPMPKREGIAEPTASPRAIEYAKALVAGRVGGERYADVDLDTAPRSQVSSIIDALKLAPLLPPRICDLEVGAYRHNGVIYSVRSNIENDRKYAVHIVEIAPEVWDWSERDYRLPFDIDPASRLTLKEAIAFAAQTGRCCHCGRVLTDPKSIIAGMGKVCASKYE